MRREALVRGAGRPTRLTYFLHPAIISPGDALPRGLRFRSGTKDSNPAFELIEPYCRRTTVEMDSRTRDGLSCWAESSRISRTKFGHYRRTRSRLSSNVDDERPGIACGAPTGRLTASRACTLLVYFRLNMVAAGARLGRAVKYSSSLSSSAAAAAYYDRGRRTLTGHVPRGHRTNRLINTPPPLRKRHAYKPPSSGRLMNCKSCRIQGYDRLQKCT